MNSVNALRPVLSSKKSHSTKKADTEEFIFEDQKPPIWFTFQPTDELISMNDAAAVFFGFRPEKVRGKNISILFKEKELDIMQQHIASITPDNPIITYEIKTTNHIGQKQWIEWTIFIESNDTTKERLINAIGQNITEYKESYNDLKKSEKRYRAVVEAQMELVCRYKPDCTLTFVNDAYCSFMGKSKDNLIGHKILEEVNKEDGEKLCAFIASVSKDNPTNTQVQRVITKKGERLWVEWRRRAFFTETGQLYEVQAVGRDITDLKKTEQALLHSEKTLKQNNQELERKNIALQEVLANIENQKQQIKDNVIANIDNCLLPLIERFKRSCSDDNHVLYVELIKKNLNELTSAFGKKLSMDNLNLTTKEREISTLIMNGLTSKEIADLLHISINTVGRHRNNIRKKLNITNQQVNLPSFLHQL